MAYDGLITKFLGQGLAADRDATPNIHPDAIGLYWATDTEELSTWVDGAWRNNVLASAIAWGAITGTLTDQTDLTAYIAAQIAALVASAPGALDTLDELAAALGDDASFASTVTAALAAKLAAASNLSDLANAATARTNLGLLRMPAFFFTTAPIASEVLCLYAAADAFTIPANLVGTQVKIGTNPAATFAIDVKQNGVTIATISIATSGTVTLSTTSGPAKAIAVGDLLAFVAPATPDASIANVAVTAKGTL